ncbi:MAG: exodeoxyribonuclease VII large subunit [gamma proteobacterium symbiont of Taylorina sp.]|nr:exodeoxyribonuclease VII large subunit [gamma proteobacterium symbiont of Taylorina sp.]
MNYNHQSNILSVSEFVRNVKSVLESNFPSVWISGEISNLAMPRSGHWYFTLKDDRGQVRCAMFRQSNQRLRFKPDEGNQVLVKAHVSLYEARGDFQLIIDSMEDVGAGALQRAYDELKLKLQTQGLFDQQHKKTLPEIPNRIGIITSATGAALHDILNVLKRRFPSLAIIIYPAQVQGKQASEQLIHALKYAQQQALCDVLIIGRGGGSIEDLWAFNNEQLAQIIFQCSIPIISAVGHEVDFTICDFVADVRAATPSAAAELVSPDQAEWKGWLLDIENRLIQLVNQKISSLQQQLQWQQKQLKHPGQALEEISQRVDELSMRMEQSLLVRIQLHQEKLFTINAQLQLHSPIHSLNQKKEQLAYIQQRLQQTIQSYLDQQRQRLSSLAREMDAYSPLTTLGRGYTLVKDEHNKLVKSGSQLKVGQKLKLHFAQDQALVTVNKLTHKTF